MEVSRVCYESASAASFVARRRRIEAWAAEMDGLASGEALELAAWFDQGVEFDPYFTDQEKQDAFQSVAPHLRVFEIGAAGFSVPVYPLAARTVIEKASEPESTLRDLERLGEGDPVLAGSLISAANSSLYGTRQPVTGIGRAIAHLGTDTARQVLLAASMRTLIGAPQHHSLWQHSLEMAQACDRLARVSDCLPASEAFLAGLMHDIGRIAFVQAPRNALDKFDRLVAAGCPLPAVELALFGCDHCQFGARILDEWRFPIEMQNGARFHHRPERTTSPHAALLYLAAFCGQSNEDLPSLARLNAASQAIGMKPDDVVALRFGDSPEFTPLLV